MSFVCFVPRVQGHGVRVRVRARGRVGVKVRVSSVAAGASG